jgi:hypothetical protein
LKLISDDDALWRGFVTDVVRINLGLTPSQVELDFMSDALQVCTVMSMFVGPLISALLA